MQEDFISGLPFMKMHGLGNDFVVIDERAHGPVVTRSLAIAMADRHKGIGFDQLVAVQNDDSADLRLVFYNADGSSAGACGNATRCIAGWEMQNKTLDRLEIRTERGLLTARQCADDEVEVNMGAPMLDWQDVPLAEALDTAALPIEGAPTATGMGNPHCTFFVDDVDAVNLEDFGPRFEHHPLFPERTNVQVAQVTGPNRIRARIWERGVGVTLASGSSSCAIGVAAARRGLTGRSVTLDLDGGTLRVEWHDDGVLMTGKWAHMFDGLWHGPR